MATIQQKETSNFYTLLKSATQVVGGCTQINEELTEQTISTYGQKEFTHIEKHERFIDIGSAVTLNDLLALGKHHIPRILYEALETISNPIIRNMATIGGNVCALKHRHTLYAPLLALDSILEFKNQTETQYVSLYNFSNFKEIPKGFVLSNIRVANPDANLSIFRRIGPEHMITPESASYAFLATTGKNIIESVRIAFAGNFVFRNRELENSFMGRRLPLTKKDIEEIQLSIREAFEKTTMNQMVFDVMKQQFFNLTKYSLEQLM